MPTDSSYSFVLQVVMAKQPPVEAPPAPGAPRDPRRQPRRGDLFKATDGSLLRVGPPSVSVAQDGVEIPCLILESTGAQSKHTRELLTFGALRARVAKADVLHRGPSVEDPWRTAPRYPIEPIVG
jgi:hypothetical protein